MSNRSRLFRTAVATLAVFGAGFSVHAQDAAALVEEFQTKLSELKAFSSDMTMKMQMMGMTMEYLGDVSYLDQQFVMTMNIEMMGQKMGTRSVMDKSGIMWTEVDMGGMKQVVKTDTKALEGVDPELAELAKSPSGLGGGNPMDTVNQMLESFDLTLDGKDTLGGVEVYRLSAEVKEENKGELDPTGQMEQMGVTPEKLSLAFGVEDGFPREYTVLGPDGAVVMQTIYSNVNLQPDIDPSIFEYTPPEGVPVTDFMEMMQGAMAGADTGAGPFELGSPPPDFTGTSLAGDEVSLSDYKGKVVLIDFWATWCGPCVHELPNVIDAYKAYHDKGFEIVAISLDDSKEDLVNFLKERPDMTWVQLFDGKGWETDIAMEYGVEAIPFTLLLDKEGNVVRQGLRGEALSNALADLFGG